MTKIFDWLLGLFTGRGTAAIALVAALASGWLGWTANGWRWETRMAGMEASHAREAAARAQAVSEALENARAQERRGDEIAARLLDAEAARIRISKEKDDVLRKQTTGRPCLDASVVGLLNAGSGSDGTGLKLPEAARSPAAAHSALAADPDLGHVTDTDIALWANHARSAHNVCRARIDALREIFKATP